MEPGSPGLDKLRKRKMQWSSAWLKIKAVSAAGDRAGLSAHSRRVFERWIRAGSSPLLCSDKDDLTPARDHCSCICVL